MGLPGSEVATTSTLKRGKQMQQLKGVEEAARLLGISKWTVRGYIREGKLKAVRLGRRVLVEEGELERFVTNARTCEQLQQDSTTEHPAARGEHVNA
jgi:excisionase family DNA binding protein